jgi:1-phosphatidylinositol-4-phosphate 5-kinase
MNNVFKSPLSLQKRFDLKGSTLGRFATESEKQASEHILKDQDVVRTNQVLVLTRSDRLLLEAQLTTDLKFLVSHNVMDYSFLLGISEFPTENHASAHSPLPPHGFTTKNEAILRRGSVSVASAHGQQPSLNSTPVSIVANIRDASSNISPNTIGRHRGVSVASAPSHHTLSPTNIAAADKASSAKTPQLLDINDPKLRELSMRLQNTSPRKIETSGANTITSASDNSGVPGVMDFTRKRADADPVYPCSVWQKHEGGLVSSGDTQEIYFFGIIDVLQSYNTKKTLETAVKAVLYETDEISSVPPDQYAQRFFNFMRAMLVEQTPIALPKPMVTSSISEIKRIS